jgi:hypothetical protein
MMTEKDGLTAIGFAVTWIAGIFGAGRAYGKLSDKVEKHDTEIAILKMEFKTPSGDQRLMSFDAHDKIQATCQKRMDERHDTLAGRLDKHDEKLDKILEAVSGRRQRFDDIHKVP